MAFNHTDYFNEDEFYEMLDGAESDLEPDDKCDGDLEDGGIKGVSGINIVSDIDDYFHDPLDDRCLISASNFQVLDVEVSLEDVSQIMDMEKPACSSKSIVFSDVKVSLEDVSQIMDMDTYDAEREVNWCRNVTFPEKPPYKSTADLTTDPLPSCMDYFFEYLPLSFWQEAVVHTNNYIERKMPVKCPIQIEELITFLALNIATGIFKFPNIAMYWDVEFGLNIFKKNMASKRFLYIRNVLHFVSTESGDDDRLFKVRPIYNSILMKCKSLKKETNLCVDEQMVPFKGKLNIKQYLKGKPKPWGVKIYILANSDGQVLDFLIYQGSKTEYNPELLSKYGSSGATVLHFVGSLPPEEHNLFCDNYFLSYKLMKELSQRKINCAGTIRVNRFKSPQFLTDKELNKTGRGSMDILVNAEKDIGVMKWMDSKAVVMCSNFILKGTPNNITRYDRKLKQEVSISQPEVNAMYNECMGGVDKYDQLISYYRINHRSKKWTVRLTNRAIDMAVTSAYLEFQKDYKSSLALLDFRKQVVKQLLNFIQQPLYNTRNRQSLPIITPKKTKVATSSKSPSLKLKSSQQQRDSKGKWC